MLEKIFKLKENNTTARTEIIAGLTTFMTMAYIIALNPNLLTGFGKDTMPGAMAKGLFARNAITMVPIADAIQVARKTPFQSSGMVSLPKPVSRFGFRAII